MITVDQSRTDPASESLFNQNYLDQDWLIQNIYRGKQTGPSVRQAGRKLLRLGSKLRARNKPVLIMTDVSKLGDINLTARKIGLDLMCSLDYDRCSVIGCNYATYSLVKLMINVSGRGFKIRIFDNKSDAKSWLLSK